MLKKSDSVLIFLIKSFLA